MMKFTIQREMLLKPLQQVCGPLTGRPAMPILGNIYLKVEDNILSLISTDLEIEMIVQLPLEAHEASEEGVTTVTARKFLDICRGLPDDANLTVTQEEQRILIRSGRSRYSLSTLPAQDFPRLDDWQSELSFELPRASLKKLIEATQFSMAHQDVRYYLNGMLFETDTEQLRTVATDGHRLAVCALPMEQTLSAHSVILPRKGVMELTRLLDGSNQLAQLMIGRNNLRAKIGHFTFTSKLIDGRFPDYRRVLPQRPDKILEANCEDLKHAFSRAAILSNEKFRGVRLQLSHNQLKITANNPDQEEAEEVLDVSYQGEPLEIGFNVNYLLDVLNSLKCERIRMMLIDPVSSIQIENSESNQASYVIMPMRL